MFEETNEMDPSQQLSEKALLERPGFSIRFQIALGFLIFFILVVLSNFFLWSTIHKIEKKLYFLKASNSYLFEIQQARRFEKNFFLYGTNLEDALANVESAKEHLLLNSDVFRKVTGDKFFNKKVNDVKHYEMLLNKLRLSGRGNAEVSEEEIRRFGGEMVGFAQDLVKREQNVINQMFIRVKRTPIYFLLVLFLFIIYWAAFLIKRIMEPIGRFLGYTRRIADGDFSPITPARKYRDEFSKLAIAINRMLNELNRRQQILVESHKLRAVGTLTAGVAHELNNPINNITLTAYSLMEDYDETSDEEKMEMIKDLVGEADRSQRIVRNLLDFARESESKLEASDLGDIVKETVRLAGNQIRLSEVELQFDIEPNLQRIHGDKQQLEQAFLNFIMNALDAMQHQDPKILKIEVRNSKRPGYLEVRIADSGEGIPEHILPDIFDPFFTTKDTGKGTGLGLSVAQGIVAKHGGRIDVSSKTGNGTTFSVILPITTIPADIESTGLKDGRRDADQP